MRIKIHHVLLALFLFLLLTSYLRNVTALSKNMYFINDLKNQLDREQQKNNELKLKEAKSKDPFEAEKKIRDTLGLTRQGEKIIIAPTQGSAK